MSALPTYALDANGNLVIIGYHDSVSLVNTPNSMPVANRATMVITQTIVVVSGAADQLVAANPNRKYLAFFNIGASYATIAPGPNVVQDQGYPLTPGSASAPGGGFTFDGAAITTDAWTAISSGTTSILVWEGN
jgi:hypothetical protein